MRSQTQPDSLERDWEGSQCPVVAPGVKAQKCKTQEEQRPPVAVSLGLLETAAPDVNRCSDVEVFTCSPGALEGLLFLLPKGREDLLC